MIRGFLAAISFLSILPAGSFRATEADLKRSLAFFPLAGLLFAALGWGFAYLLIGFLPPLPTALLLTLFPEILTKGFHLDGLADTADGMLSSRPRERKLEIMRDSQIGTMGVAAIFAVLGLKFTLYASLPAASLPFAAAFSLLGGRCGMALYIAISRSARPDGLGALWCAQNPVAGVLMALLLPAAGCRVWGLPALGAIPLLLAAAALWKRLTARVLGGATGDTIGCFEEFSELAILALLISLPAAGQVPA